MYTCIIYCIMCIIYCRLDLSILCRPLNRTMSSGIVLKRCGVRFDPPAIVVIYTSRSSSNVHRRTMPLRKFTKRSSVVHAVEELRSKCRHQRYLEQISTPQLERLVGMIHDRLNGLSRAEVIGKVSLETFQFHSDHCSPP